MVQIIVDEEPKHNKMNGVGTPSKANKETKNGNNEAKNGGGRRGRGT